MPHISRKCLTFKENASHLEKMPHHLEKMPHIYIKCFTFIKNTSPRGIIGIYLPIPGGGGYPRCRLFGIYVVCFYRLTKTIKTVWRRLCSSSSSPVQGCRRAKVVAGKGCRRAKVVAGQRLSPVFTDIVAIFYRCFTDILPIFYRYFTDILTML